VLLNPDDPALLALLEFYASCGVDLALENDARDSYADSARAEAPPAKVATAPAAEAESKPSSGGSPRMIPAAARATPEEAARLAEEAAASATTLAELRDRLAAFDGCGFKAMAQHFMFSAGSPAAELMAMDFGPGDAEERDGVAFSGETARLLDNMLGAIGRDRDSAYLAYFSPWRPAGDASPPSHEVKALLPFARRHVELARPKILLLLGDAAARPMLNTPLSGAKLYGKWMSFACGGETIPAAALPGLRAMLKAAELKRGAWRILRDVAVRLAI
jgi:uracil-DNA glycosylase family 4